MRFKKPKPIHRPVPVSAAPPAADLDLLLTANALVLTTEDKNKFIALYREYLDEYKPQGPTQCDLVEEMVAAKWRQRRCSIIETGILNITMDRMADSLEKEFVNLPNSIRTALAFIDQHGAEGALARVARDEARYTRTWHRALKLLRELQNEKKPNEPERALTLVPSIGKEEQSPPVAEPPPAGSTPANPRDLTVATDRTPFGGGVPVATPTESALSKSVYNL